MGKTRYARIITMKAKPGKGDEFVRTFRDEVASSAVGLEGMRRLYLLRPVGKKDELVVLSLWDDEKSAGSYAKSDSNKAYADALKEVQQGKERVRKFNVEVHVLGKAAEGTD